MAKTAFQKHLAAIEAGEVTKSNIIGIRKVLNAYVRRSLGYSVSWTQPEISSDEITATEWKLDLIRPRVIGELHESGVKLLRSPRYRKRFNEKQAGIIERLDHFKLLRFDYIGERGMHTVPVYLAVSSTGESFAFRNIAWQSGGDGPEIVEAE